MERDELIITVYCWVCDQMQGIRQDLHEQGLRLRQGGFAPSLTDEEALTIELVGEMLRLRTDKALYAYFRAHWRHFFPRLPHRTSFVRQCANLWRIKQFLLRRLLRQMHEWTSRLQPVDTLPLSVCARARARRDRCVKEVAKVSFCASQNRFYYGFKLALRISPCGLIMHHALVEANRHDTQHLQTCVEGHEGLVPVDKGFFDPRGWRILAQQGVHLVGRGPRKVDHCRPQELKLPPGDERRCFTLRKLIETVGAHLCQRLGVDSIRAYDLWHYEHRLLRKILAHNLLVTLNLRRGHAPLDFDHLVGD